MLAPGSLIENKYRVGRVVGRGGMGAVYEAEAIHLHRRVAIKVQHPSVNDSEASGEMAARFQLEAQAAGRIGSRHVVDVIDLGRLASGEHFMVMEYLDGQSLRDRIAERGALSAAETLPIAEQLLVGVAAAHAAGIIHRDLKPENVFLMRHESGADFVKILDFGISKFNDLRASKGLSLTRTGALMGTPRYLSPEQAMGAKLIDHRTDIYMVGVILYECVTGAVPYSAESFNELLFRIVQERPVPIRERVPGADPSLVALIECAMQKEPKLRFQTAEDMVAAVRACARGEAWSPVVAPASVPGDGSRAGSGVASGAAAAVSAREPSSFGLQGSGEGAPSVSESGAGSWAKSRSGTSTRSEGAPVRTRSMLPWISAAVVSVVVGGVLAVSLSRTRAKPVTDVTQPLPDAAASRAQASNGAERALAPSVEPIVSAAPSASVTLPLVGAARARVDASRSKLALRGAATATPPARAEPPGETAVKTEVARQPASPEDVSRLRGGRVIRGDL